MIKWKKHLKRKKTVMILCAAALTLLAAGQLLSPDPFIKTAEAAETGTASEPPEAPIRLERTLTYGYGAEEARIPVEFTNTGDEAVSVTVEKCELTDSESGFSLASAPEAGAPLVIEPGGSETICTVQFETGRAAGMSPYTGMLPIEYKDEAAGSLEQVNYRLSVTVKRKSINSCTVDEIGKQYYTGKAVEPAVTVYDGGYRLTAGQDYTVDYTANTSLGKSRVLIKGIKNYEGITEKDFEIVYYDEMITVLFNQALLSEGWYSENVTVAADGCTISDSLDGSYEDTYTVTGEGVHTLSLHFKTAEGYITDACGYTVKIDKASPAADSLQISGITDTAASVSIAASDTGSGVSQYYLYCTTEERKDITAEEIKESENTLILGAEDAVSGTAVFQLDSLSEGTTYYLYAAAEDISGKFSEVQAGSFTTKQPVPDGAVSLTLSASADTITAGALTDTETYGAAKYRLLDASGQKVVQDWQDGNVFSGLAEGTGYTVCAKYAGNDSYMESAPGNAQITTKRWAPPVTEPAGLTASYGQTLKDVALPEGWSWADDTAAVTAGNSGYEARFVPADTDIYDYSRAEGYAYDSGSGQVTITRTLPVEVSMEVPVLSWKDGNTQKAVYTGKAAVITPPEVTLPGNEPFGGTIRYSWRRAANTGGSFTSGLPSEVGTYTIRASVEADGNYGAASADMTLTIDWLWNAPDAKLTDQSGASLAAGAWSRGAVLTAPAGYGVSFSLTGTFGSSVQYLSDTGRNGVAAVYYLKNSVSGEIARKTVNLSVDRTDPTGSISVGGAAWSQMLPAEGAELGISEKKAVTISTDDAQSGVKTVEYTISSRKCKNREEIQKLGGWLIYNPDAKPEIKDSGTNYVYVRITDHAGNTSWVSTGRIEYKASEASSGSSGNTGNSGGTGAAGSTTPTTPATPSRPAAGTGSGTGNSSKTEKTPEPGVAYVKGRKSVNGWTAIKRLLEEAGEGDTETLIMNGASIVPGNVLAVLKGRDVTLVLDMGDGMSWTLNGQSFTEVEFGDIDFSVEIKTGIIPDDIIRSLAGDRNTIQLSLAYDGAFGFTASLSLDLEEKNAGLYASLFAYDGQEEKLEFITSSEIGEDGCADFDFTHASDYAIVIDEAPFDGSAQQTETEEKMQETELELEEDRSKEKAEFNRLTALILVACLLVLAAGAGICIWILRRKRKEDTE